jgi:adenylate cyclase class IV
VTDDQPCRNLELKARYRDLERARRAALSLGAEDGGVLRQRDTYFRAPAGRLKLREIETVQEGSASSASSARAELIFYRRDESGAERWSNYRITPVSDPAGMKALLADALGLRGVVAKRREVFLRRGCRIHLDTVETLGRFIEFEVISVGDAEDDRARMETLRTAFGIEPPDMIPGSYADLLELE